MKEIIDWLISVEHLANDFYFIASKLFPEDRNLTSFLEHIADDEAFHYHIMGSAAEYLVRSKSKTASSIIIDNSIKEKIEIPFKANLELAKRKELGKEPLLDCIISGEFSEWNEIFVYVVDSLKSEERLFEHSASKIQNHLNHIVHYLGSIEYCKEKIEELKKVPSVWKQKILIVDDDEAISSLLSAILHDEWEVDLANNGREALAKLNRSHYDLIISDIDMPVMDGIEFYDQASSFIEKLHTFFIFHSGQLTYDRKEQFEKNGITYLQKPSSIETIRNVVREKLQSYTIK